MELLQLHYFCDSAKYESFAKVAQKYMVPTPSVASSIKRLEKELNCQLFDRYPNQIALNKNGQKLLNILAPAIEKIDSIPLLLSESLQDGREINILIRAMTNEITHCIFEYKKRHPEVNINITLNHPEEDYHNYHLVIDEKSDIYNDYDQYDVSETELILLVPKGHPLGKDKVNNSDLHNKTFVYPAKGSAVHRASDQFFARVGVTPNVAFYCDDLSIYKKSILAGIGIGIGRRHAYTSPVSKDFDVVQVPWFVSQILSIYYKPQDLFGNVKHFFDFIAYKDFFLKEEFPYIALS